MQVPCRARKMRALLKLTGEGCSPSFLRRRRSKHHDSSPSWGLFWVHLVQALVLLS